MNFARSRAFAAAFALGFTPVAALGCGICIEDKVATAYDHALTTRAIASGRVVVFAEVTGQGDPHARVLSARAAAANVPGVDGASIRSNDAPAVLSFVLDTRTRSPEAALALAQGSPGRDRFQLTLLKVLR
jgi:hypothetical protein